MKLEKFVGVRAIVHLDLNASTGVCDALLQTRIEGLRPHVLPALPLQLGLQEVRSPDIALQGKGVRHTDTLFSRETLQHIVINNPGKRGGDTPEGAAHRPLSSMIRS